MDLSNCGVLVNCCVCLSFLIFGVFYPSEHVPLYYATLLELFITFELFVLVTSVVIMVIGKLFGERIQKNKEWQFSVMILEIIETTKCVFVVAGITTFPVVRSRMGYEIGLTWDFYEATQVVDNFSGNLFFKCLYLVIKTIGVWIAADGWTYFKHYTLHNNKKYFWQFHKQHHSFGNPTAFASFSVCPLEALWTHFLIVLLGVPSFPLVGKQFAPIQLSIILFFVVLNIYLHCGYSLYYIETTLPYLYINTSAHHNIHHEKTVSNFAEVLVFWDYVLGTYHRERHLQSKEKFGWSFIDFSSRHEKFKSI